MRAIIQKLREKRLGFYTHCAIVGFMPVIGNHRRKQMHLMTNRLTLAFHVAPRDRILPPLGSILIAVWLYYFARLRRLFHPESRKVRW